MERKLKDTPPRLGMIFQKYDPPLFFVTSNTYTRRSLLASAAVHDAFRIYCERGIERDIGVGRYVIMPDHITCSSGLASVAGLRWEAG